MSQTFPNLHHGQTLHEFGRNDRFTISCILQGLLILAGVYACPIEPVLLHSGARSFAQAKKNGNAQAKDLHYGTLDSMLYLGFRLDGLPATFSPETWAVSSHVATPTRSLHSVCECGWQGWSSLAQTVRRQLGGSRASSVCGLQKSERAAAAWRCSSRSQPPQPTPSLLRRSLLTTVNDTTKSRMS